MNKKNKNYPVITNKNIHTYFKKSDCTEHSVLNVLNAVFPPLLRIMNISPCYEIFLKKIILKSVLSTLNSPDCEIQGFTLIAILCSSVMDIL